MPSFELDQDNYQYAVSGPNHSYLWILARLPSISNTVKKQLIQKQLTQDLRPKIYLCWINNEARK